MSKGKIITVTSSKGGVGKTILALNLAGAYHLLNKRVLLIDGNIYGGVIALNLALKKTNTLFDIINDIKLNKFMDLDKYVNKYSNYIDVISAYDDPRTAIWLDYKYINYLLEKAVMIYDIIIIDTNHGLNQYNVNYIYNSNIVLHVITNDIMDLKNTSEFIKIMKDSNTDNIKILLNNSKDPNLNYFSNFDIKDIISHNVDYVIDKRLYIENITKYLLEGKILLLNKNLVYKDKNDYIKFINMAKDIIGGDKNEK